MKQYATSPLTLCLKELMSDHPQMLALPWVRNIALHFINDLARRRSNMSNEKDISIKDLVNGLSVHNAKQLGAILATEGSGEDVIKELNVLLHSNVESVKDLIWEFSEGLNLPPADRTSLHIYALMLLNWEAVNRMTGPKQLSDFLLECLPQQLSDGIRGNLYLKYSFPDRVRKLAKRNNLRFIGRKAAPKSSRTPLSPLSVFK